MANTSNRLSAGEAVLRMARKRHKARDVVEACLDRIEKREAEEKLAEFKAKGVVDLDAPADENIASLAKAAASEAYMQTAIHTVQIHGGIGFTWEHDAHLYFKRARSSELLLGDPTYHRELLAQRIGI